MSELVYLGGGHHVLVQNPQEAPQFPLDSGWWAFTVGTKMTGEFVPDGLPLQVKSAFKNRTAQVYPWVGSRIGSAISDTKAPALKKAINCLTESLGSVKLV